MGGPKALPPKNNGDCDVEELRKIGEALIKIADALRPMSRVDALKVLRAVEELL